MFSDADPTSIRHLTADQQALVTRASDRTKAALSAAEWRYLFKLRYAFFPGATAQTDPVVVKALTAIAQDTPSCGTGGTSSVASVDVCERFVNVGKCWTNSPVAESTIPCFTWAMMVAGSLGCSLPNSAAATYVDSEAWDDAQDGRETGDCAFPCIAGGSCSHGVCKCAADEARCPGGCARTKSDPSHCGGCGNACGAGIACVEGVCGGTADAGADAASDGGT